MSGNGTAATRGELGMLTKLVENQHRETLRCFAELRAELDALLGDIASLRDFRSRVYGAVGVLALVAGVIGGVIDHFV
jgi:hypothetical protein